PSAAAAEMLGADELAQHVDPPYELGERLTDDGVWSILDRSGVAGGYIFETRPLAPLPGFSGEPINVLVTLDRDGRFIAAEILEQNEPIFISGLGVAPFHEFVRQYRGLSITDSIMVGVPYGGANKASSAHVYLDGVTKATASVRIAHESILAATLKVARERMQGLAAAAPAYPDPEYEETLDWQDLVDQGLAQRRLITNAEVEKVFAGTLWEDDDPEARDDPNGHYLDLWIVDIGPPSIARAVLDAETMQAREDFLTISGHDEPILLIADGRGGLVSEDFVRNTSPDLIFAEQDGFPVALRDADLDVGLRDSVPDFEHRMILRIDRRLGFDPTREWALSIRTVRAHGQFMPQLGSHDFTTVHATDGRFFLAPEVQAPRPVWVESLLARRADLGVLTVFLAGLLAALLAGMNRLAGLRRFTPIRLAVLGFVAVFIGWWGQGQLSIVTVLGVLRAAIDGQSFAFLLYDPFSLLIWAVVLVSFLIWGRGFFCGWLCPYGALQEFTHHAGRVLGLRQVRVPDAWDRRLKWLKYGVLSVLAVAAVVSPALTDVLVEVEPFKTAITVNFVREWYFVAYAAGWLVLGLWLFKGFCRYVCPLGAVMVLGGLLRKRDWIPRRPDCGSPCQLCKVRCNYGAIERDGRVRYDECFQCLDCVTIHDDPGQCVPLVLAAKREVRP
ncbi:MAG: 4Fe-4S binding protein, partial [Rhodospirillales bacterium]|nr:4Fe-4S binding protein [Rhodospirillales bacterium]